MTAQRIATDLIDQLERGATVAHSASLLGRYSARRTDAGTLVFWGGCAQQQYKHTARRRVEIPRTYIRSPDRIGAMARLITAALQAEREQRPLLQAREALYLLTESKHLDALCTLVDKHPEMPADYDFMTLAHCAAWTPLIQALPDAQVAA